MEITLHGAQGAWGVERWQRGLCEVLFLVFGPLEILMVS